MIPKKNKGFALVLAIVISAFLFSLIAILGTSMVYEAKQASSQQKKTQAYYIARAGASATEKWITSLTGSGLDNFNSEIFPVHSIVQNFGGGTFQVTLTQTSDQKQLLIASTGSVANGKNPDGTTSYVIDNATVVLNKTTTTTNTNATTQINTAIYGRNRVNITSYVNGDVGTSSSAPGAIKFDWGLSSSNISNIYIPSGGNPDIIITKTSDYKSPKPTIKTFDGTLVYPAPTLPSFPSFPGNLTFAELSSSGTITQSCYYAKINIVSGAILKVDTSYGDINLRIGNLNIYDGSIILIGNHNLNLYVDNSIFIKGPVNSGGDKSHFKLYYNGTNLFDIGNGTNINGSLSSNTANLNIVGGSVVTGDIFTAGSTVTISNGTVTGPNLIYAPLADITINTTINSSLIGKTVTVESGTVNMPPYPVLVQIPGATTSSTSTIYSTPNWK
ncbi:pilus assembly PilX N-terminal domain-containing protein [Clostridium sp.]|uniref:pilus assembly PilX N-terminal domain-containing protein n=1 Tax=Clostridium sp. TaxID=1506 RepID=UPI0026275727|nr:pilus assembly PilX N-terminal domain-containing protein [uncultured Clostridium sp.]